MKRAKTPEEFLEYKRLKTGKMVPCTGEAHSNAFIDNCAVCMPYGWGEVPEMEPKLSAEQTYNLLSQGMAVKVNDVANEAFDTLSHDRSIDIHTHSTKNSSYCQFRAKRPK